MKTRNFGLIKAHPKAWKPLKKRSSTKPVAGLDTETSLGQAFIIGADYARENVIKRLYTFKDFLDLLVESELHEYDGFFYNINYDANALIKLMPIANQYQMAEREMTELVYAGEKVVVTLIPNKLLNLTFRGKRYDFYDISQFYGRQSLKKVAKKILGDDKGEVEDIKNLSPERYDKDEEYREQIDRYLRQDASLCRRLADKFIETAAPFLCPKAYYSTAKLSEQYFLENHAEPGYNILLPPNIVQKAALKAYNGGRFEVLKRGTFTNVYIYDIRSAYPYHNSMVPDPGRGEWFQNNQFEKNSLISILRVIARGKSLISPLRHTTKEGRLLYPQGRKEYWINKSEYEVLKEYGFDVTVLEAWHYRDRNPVYLFKWLQEFYDWKERVGKDHPHYGMIKTLINGFYGKTIATVQRKNKYGEKLRFYKAGRLFSPVVANEITANTRSQLLRAVREHQEQVIAFATDSIMSVGPLPIDTGNALGQWALEHAGVKVTIIGSGVYYIHEKEVLHLRGFDKNLKLKDLQKQGNAQQIVFPMEKPVPLKMSARMGLMENMNVFLPMPRRLDINFDEKRVWDAKAWSFNQLLHKQFSSKPYTLVWDDKKKTEVMKG